MSGRIAGLHDAGRGPRALIEFTFAGEKVVAWAGDSIAMALWAAGTTAVRNSSRQGAPRGVWCNMGICYECLVVVDGQTVRACTTTVRAGMVVEPGGRP